MGKKKSNFFDSRDKYLSFINSTNEKSKIAFEIATYLKKTKIKGDAFKIFDAGTGDGTIISTLLSAVHDKFPEDPIIVVGKEISIDDINALLSYLGYRFYEHKNLVFCVTNVSYQDIYNQNFDDFNFLKNRKIKSPKRIQKIAIPVKTLNSPNWEADSPNKPATLFPRPVVAKYSPIISDAYLAGASLVTNESDTGDKLNSPIVWNKYASTNQYIAEDPVLSFSTAAALINKNPIPIISRPIIIVKREDASLPFNFRLAQKAATVVPKVMIKNALSDWNHEAGTSHPNNILLV